MRDTRLLTISRIFGEEFIVFAGMYLPWFEVLLGLSFLSREHRRTAALTMAVLLGCFSALLLRAHLSGSTADCGCGGVKEYASGLFGEEARAVASLIITGTLFVGSGWYFFVAPLLDQEQEAVLRGEGLRANPDLEEGAI